MDDEIPSELVELPAMTDPAARRMLGLFDTPAFVRRGQDLEHRIELVRARCRHERSAYLEPVQMRLRQWAAVATDASDHRDVFPTALTDLWTLCEAAPPKWARVAGSARRRRAAAAELVASLNRFNARWNRFLETFDLSRLNHAIELYNTFYLFEKECSLGSVRLASMHFQPRAFWTHADLMAAFPPLPVPAIRPRGG